MTLMIGECGGVGPTLQDVRDKENDVIETVSAQRAIFDLQAISLRHEARTIQVQGRTRTGGWTDPSLVIVAEAGGEVCLSFVATPPTGLVTQALAPVEASFPISELPDGTQTVTVLSERTALSIDIPG